AGPDVDEGEFPRLMNLSAGHMYRALIRPETPTRPEYVTISAADGEHHLQIMLAQWNLLWEAGQFRRRMFGRDDLPEPMARIADRGDINVLFVPRTTSRYHEYAPLLHLLPAATLTRFGLPLLRSGQWPHIADYADIDRFLPRDFEQRLVRAWAHHVWRHLVPGSPASSFTRDDPIRLLAHNLDFWLPAVTEVMQGILRDLPYGPSDVPEGPVRLEDGSSLPGATLGPPRIGSPLWYGADEAAEATALTVEAADRTGQLRGILEAVKANRVADDFSARWSFAKEDFERKLYSKRSKTKVTFVELPDTIPVQGPETEIVDRMVFADFLTLLDPKERHVVVLLNSGMTNLTDIAETLGYANHSPVSKRLARIRRKAQEHFDAE
ncbi:MAG: hypothetical protein JWM93_1878, partial [Frankiales bacterium]|nr:hypothetical protein [Frankiales bacterium]